jgi:hypothetical protein
MSDGVLKERRTLSSGAGMGTHETLAPDQRAVLELVLRQGRSYGELSELLAIPEREVRARADAGIRALAGEPAPGVDSGRIGDWLLGQQPAAEAERTRAAVTRDPTAHDWAITAADHLRDLGGTIPELPPAPQPTDERAAAPAGPDALKAPTSRATPRPAPGRAATRADPDALKAPTPQPPPDEAASLPSPPPRDAAPARSSKLGGAILIGVVAVVLVGVGAWFLARDDDEPAADEGSPSAQTQPDETGEPQPTGNDIVLSGSGNSQARGLMRLFRRDDGSVQFAIAAENVPPNRGREVYAVWFTRNSGAARRLGFAQAAVGKDGVLTTGGPQRGDEDKFPRWFATYDNVMVTRETDAKAKKPGRAVLRGTLPGGG